MKILIFDINQPGGLKKGLYILLLSLAAGSRSFCADGVVGDWAVDSLLPVASARIIVGETERVDAGLLDLEKSYQQTGNSRATLSGLVKLLRLKNPLWSSKLRTRLYNDLAGVSVRLKLYPIAMKCFDYERFDPDSVFDSQLEGLDTTAVVLSDTESTPVAIQDILAAFDDGKTASSYAILVHVKQPIPGKRKAFTHINNVGHMFISLIKYNRDHSYVCRSFGFYPHKANLLSATPLHPRSPSVVKDDSRHGWDEVAGKFISHVRFKRVLEFLQSYDHRDYHLGRNNCTDFGLAVAGIGGITIADTRGRWPLGKGNTPGSAGQSMLEGKTGNIDAEFSSLFTADNLSVRADTATVRANAAAVRVNADAVRADAAAVRAGAPTTVRADNTAVR